MSQKEEIGSSKRRAKKEKIVGYFFLALLIGAYVYLFYGSIETPVQYILCERKGKHWMGVPPSRYSYLQTRYQIQEKYNDVEEFAFGDCVGAIK